MILQVLFVLCTVSSALGQYEDYESYQTFSDLDKYQRDYGLTTLVSAMHLSASDDNSVTGQTVTSRSRDLSFYDFKFGYIFRTGFYFGLLYAGDVQNINSSAVVTSRESIGLTLGYVHRGWAFTGSFLPYSTQRVSGDIDVGEYSRGLGFQVDLAYYFRLGRYVSVGPQILYKNISYSEAEAVTGNADRPAQSTHSVLTPMVTFLFNIYRG